ncbi:MAG: hypothetical protein ABH967_02565, partial [Patescibacteria group bacterium]
RTFLKNIGSNHILQNQKLIFSFKFPFNLAAEPRSGEAETLTYPKWWTILKLARTFFAACGGEGKPRDFAARRVL